MNDLFTLKDKVIVVTGAGGLLGFEYCKAILSANGIPILIDINEKLLKAKVSELKDKYPNFIFDSFVVDITNEKLLKRLKKIIIVYWYDYFSGEANR